MSGEQKAPVTLPLRVRLPWAVVATAPVATALAGLAALLFLLLLLMVVTPGAADPPSSLLIYFALPLLGFGYRVGRVTWQRWRELRRGRPEVVVDRTGIGLRFAGEFTHLPWSQVTWVGVMSNVPPRRRAPTLVVGLIYGAPHPPAGFHYAFLRWYEPEPRWYEHLRAVRLADLTLAEDPGAVSETVRRFAKRRWRTEPPAEVAP